MSLHLFRFAMDLADYPDLLVPRDLLARTSLTSSARLRG